MAEASSLALLVGGRIDAAHFQPDTGLVAVSVYAGERVILGIGVGPHVRGVGLLPRVPRLHASATHPFVAAMRAHLVDHRVRNVSIDDDVLWLVAGGAEITTRLGAVPGRRGEVWILAPDGSRVARWPANGGDPAREWTLDPDLAETGRAMVDASDRSAVEQMRTVLMRAISRRRVALFRRVEAVRTDLARLDEVATLQKTGRLLLAQGERIARGASRALLDDWESGGTLEVSLDPSRPAKPQAEGFFARARRLQRGEAVMQKRLDDAQRAADALDELAREAETAVDESALEPVAIRARAFGAGVVATSGRLRASARESGRKPFHRYHGANGRVIMVGRGAKDNDALTTRHARPHDLWLHAKGVAGAHVVVPLEKGTSCPAELLVDAATLAAHFSDARGESVCEVSYLERRYVRKPRGSAPGAVTHDREKVIAVRIEPARLERLLATRDE